jgi:DNA-3-methyladenine glycosylase I
MPAGWQAKPPKDDMEYFARMTRVLFTAGLNWSMIEKKWPQFRRAFADFALTKVARFSEKDVRGLMKDERIVRNERKIRATVHNAGEFLALAKEFGSFRNYLNSFAKDEKRLQIDLQQRFKHLGASTARMFLWSVGYPLTPTREEKAWMASHR